MQDVVVRTSEKAPYEFGSELGSGAFSNITKTYHLGSDDTAWASGPAPSEPYWRS